ncbi:MAG: hypothetical protein ACR2I9_03120 [Candidatus Nanopelagicaceae bacterium]
MRVYIAVTAKQLEQLLTSPLSIEDYLAPAQFEFAADVDEEQQEHLISLLAAEDSMDLNAGRFGLVLAVDFSDAQLNQAQPTLEFTQVAAALYTEDGEELSWYAPEEIKFQIESWAQR